MGQSDSKVKSIEEGKRESATSSSTETTTTKVVNTTLSSASNITKILPTGILFVFQALSNLLSDNGDCKTSNKVLVSIAVGILGIACFILSLVDTFTDSSTGKVHYGIATLNGLATGSKVKPSNESNYKITLKDLFHATLAVVVFAVMALTDQNIVQCLYPSAESNIRKMYKAIPIVVSAVSSAILVLFPCKRQGISSPVSTTTTTTT
ncbi:protein DMP3-like [Cryptomeria japonica]|uniref:protein DMP3-like n=1 Tax=Cryptomeria japonica TaxID=3369 RepID=UPI0027DA72A4|nr:protein DMP3-like [Cryptomeria japonica]